MICENCGKKILREERQLNLVLKIYKGDTYQVSRRFDSLPCLEAFVALSLPRLVERLLGSTA